VFGSDGIFNPTEIPRRLPDGAGRIETTAILVEKGAPEYQCLSA
jgi:hypothetical protein